MEKFKDIRMMMENMQEKIDQLNEDSDDYGDESPKKQ